MPYKLKIFFLSLLLLPLLVVSKSIAETMGSEIEELKKQILEIQRQNQQQIEMLMKKIESLEAERASDEPKSEEFIAKKEAEDEDTWWKSIKVGYNKGFFIESADGNFETKMNIRGQFRVTVDDEESFDEDTGDVVDDETTTSFRWERLRLQWAGHAFRPWMKYKLQLDIREGSFNVRDMYFVLAYDERYAPKIGQYKVPFNREEQNSSSALQLVDRSIVNEAFSYNRDIGGGLTGDIQDIFTYEAGILQGQGSNSGEDPNDSDFLWAARVMISPLGKNLKIQPNFVKEPTIQIGGGIAYNDTTIDDGDVFDETDNEDIQYRAEGAYADASSLEALAYSADIAFMISRANLEAEYIGMDFSPDGSEFGDAYDQGWRVQGGIFLIPKVLEVAARYAYIDYDNDVFVDDTDVDNQWEITPGINYYFSDSHNWKLQADYSFIRSELFNGFDEDENRFRVQLQAYF
jgi:phosphate-selective porin OprO and OprP